MENICPGRVFAIPRSTQAGQESGRNQDDFLPYFVDRPSFVIEMCPSAEIYIIIIHTEPSERSTGLLYCFTELVLGRPDGTGLIVVLAPSTTCYGKRSSLIAVQIGVMESI